MQDSELQDSEFKEGNIVSLALTNFQVFRRQQFSFAPGLNLIAAPNGSGKSSVANAIALLFGGTPRVIGKANELAEFIRFGEAEAAIEGVVVRGGARVRLARRILRAGEGRTASRYAVDGAPVAAREYAALVAGMGVRVDSLCSFLPQERVAAFCSMAPADLLERALEGTGLSLAHYYALRGALRDVEEAFALKTTKKGLVEKSISGMQGALDELREREAVERTVRRLMYKRTRLEHDEARDGYSGRRREARALQRRVAELEAEAAAAEERRGAVLADPALDEYRRAVALVGEQNQAIERAAAEVRAQAAALEVAAVDQRALAARQRRREEQAAAKRAEAAELEARLGAARAELEQGMDAARRKAGEFYAGLLARVAGTAVPGGSVEAVRAKMARLDGAREMEALQALLPSTAELDLPVHAQNARLEQIQHQSLALTREIDALEGQKLACSEERSQRMEMLRAYHPDSHKAVLWLRKHAGLFAEEVLEPLFLHVAIAPAYQSEVEALLNFQMLSSFLAKNEADFRLLSARLKEELGLGINIAEARPGARGAPDREALRRLGMDGVVSDFVQCREEYLCMLNLYGHFDAIPVAKADLDENAVFAALPGCKRTIVGGRYAEIRRSRYGDEWVISTSRIERRSRFRRTEVDLAAVEARLAELTGQREGMRREMDALLKGREEHLRAREALKREFMFGELHKLEFSARNLARNAEGAAAALRALLAEDGADALRAIEARREAARAAIAAACARLAGLLAVEAVPALDLGRVREARLDLENLGRVLSATRGAADAHRELLGAAQAEAARWREAVERTKREVRAVEAEEGALDIEGLPVSVPEIEAEINFCLRKLESRQGQGDLLREYEDKERHLGLLRSSISELAERRAAVLAELEAERRRVLLDGSALLDPVGARFAEMFRRFGSEGALRLELVEERWALLILVRFRPEEPLAPLTGHRQSGGEKSLATVLFLLALQQCTPAPFRLVDEVNQGMDAATERALFGLLREMGMRTQFFIITPKLVPGLAFAERMNAIVLYGGAGVAEGLEAHLQATLQAGSKCI